MNKLILGTAQFGSDYGIKREGQPSEQDIERIARVAWDGGIRVIHTSWQYGLPKICEAIFSEFEWIKKTENPKYFIKGDLIGIAEYDPNTLRDLKMVDIYQVPVNVLDKRFLKYVPVVKLFDVEIHARSVFLQGLILMRFEEIPDWVPLEARNKIAQFQANAWVLDLRPYEAALGYVLGLEEVDHVIVGVNSAKQLEQLLQVKPLKWDYDFSIQDEMVLDPRRWPK